MSEQRINAEERQQVYVDAPRDQVFVGAVVVWWDTDQVHISLLTDANCVITKIEGGGDSFHPFHVEIKSEEAWD